MKKIKALSFALSAIMAVTAMGGMATYAEEAAESKPTKVPIVEAFPPASTEELYKQFKSWGMNEDEIEKLIADYFDAYEKLAESGVTVTVYPDGTGPERTTAIQLGRYIEYITYTENSGVIKIDEDDPNNAGLMVEGEATYEYDPETKNLIIGGNGLVDVYGFGSLINSFDVRSIVIDKDVIIHVTGDECDSYFWSLLAMPEDHTSWRPIYTYEDSDLVEKYNIFTDSVCENWEKDKETVEGWYPLNILPEGTDPHSVYNNKELPPAHGHYTTIYGTFDSFGDTLLWAYDPGYELVFGCEGTLDADAFIDSFTESLGDKIADFSIDSTEYMYLNLERTSVPGFENDEEGAKAYILGLIEQKKAEFAKDAAEETTEATEPAEATTEATENTANVADKTIDNTVIKVADKAEETVEDITDGTAKLDKTIGDANGDGVMNVRDSAFIASALANNSELPDTADYNKDGRKNIRDAAAMAKDIASGKI